MLSDESDNPYRAPASEPTPVAIDPTSQRLPLRSRLLKHYLRLVGVFQLVYGLLFGTVTIAQLQFAIEFRGDLARAGVLMAVVMAPLCGVLALAAFIAGIGTVRLRRWSRAWQAVYVGACLFFFAAGFVYDRVRLGKTLDDLAATISFGIPLMLPYVPLIFLTRWPGVPADMSFQTGATRDEKHFDH